MKYYRIFLGSMLVIGGLGAFYLTTRALATQNSWVAAAEQAEAAAEQAEAALPKLRSNELLLQNRLRAANAGFGAVIVARDPTYDAEGNVTLPIGTQDGLPAAENAAAPPIVHLFAPAGDDDASEYVGAFFVQQAAERQAQLTPAFVVQPGEPQTWPVGDWRVRVDVPASRAGRFFDRDADLEDRRELLGSRLNTLEQRRQSVAEARDELAVRERALLGDPDAPEISDAPEIRAGLIPATTAEELERAAALAELDRLRRAVKNANDRLRAAMAENAELLDRLPTAAPPRTARGE